MRVTLSGLRSPVLERLRKEFAARLDECEHSPYLPGCEADALRYVVARLDEEIALLAAERDL